MNKIEKSFQIKIRSDNMAFPAQCILDNLVGLADPPDTNPNWNSVYDPKQIKSNLSDKRQRQRNP